MLYSMQHTNTIKLLIVQALLRVGWTGFLLDSQIDRQSFDRSWNEDNIVHGPKRFCVVHSREPRHVIQALVDGNCKCMDRRSVVILPTATAAGLRIIGCWSTHNWFESIRIMHTNNYTRIAHFY